MSEVKWNGEGLPPFKLECEVRVKFKGSWMAWFRGVRHGQSEGLTWIEEIGCHEDDSHSVWPTGNLEFRPLRTERDKAIEAIYDLHPVDYDVESGESNKDGDLYKMATLAVEALDKGKIPGYGPTKAAKEALNVLCQSAKNEAGLQGMILKAKVLLEPYE